MELEFIKPDIVYKVAIIGDSYSGKSSILNQYINKSFNNTFTHTIGVDFYIKNIYLNEKNIKIQLWDTAGQEQYANLIRSYFTNCTAAIIVYDISNRESFNKVEYWLRTLTSNFSEERPCILVGNKNDLNTKREVLTREGEEKANQLNMEFIECSSKKNENIIELFDKLTLRIINMIHTENFKPTPLNGLKIYSEHNSVFTIDEKKCCVIF